MKRWIALPAAMVVTLAAAGCGSSPSFSAASSPGTAASSPVSTAPALPAYDPPHHFSSTAVDVGSGPVALADGVAYSYTDTSLVATELATGSQRWSVPLPGASGLVTGAMNQDQRSTPPAPQIVTNATGGSLIVAAYPVTITGSGTQQDTTQIQVVAVAPTGQVLWRQTVAASDLVPRVVGGLHDSRGAAVVIDGGNVAAVLDAGSGATWWTVPNDQPVGVDGDVVIGVQSTDYSGDWTGLGLHGSDGTQIWNVGFGSTAVTIRPPTVAVAGTGRAAVTDNGDTMLIDTTTGKTVATLADPDPTINLGFNDCQFDERTTVVCWEAQGEGSAPAAVAGFDSQDGHPLWNVTDQDPHRTTITVTCVYHAVIYGNAQHGPVELDARTGNDLVDDPGLAPTQVTPGWGLYTDLTSQTHPTTAYQATN